MLEGTQPGGSAGSLEYDAGTGSLGPDHPIDLGVEAAQLARSPTALLFGIQELLPLRQ